MYLCLGFSCKSCVSKKVMSPMWHGWSDNISKNMKPRLRASFEEPEDERDGSESSPHPSHRSPFPDFQLYIASTTQSWIFHSAYKMWLLSARFAWDCFHALFGKWEGWGADWWYALDGAAQQTHIATDLELLMLTCAFMSVSPESVPHSHGFGRALTQTFLTAWPGISMV